MADTNKDKSQQSGAGKAAADAAGKTGAQTANQDPKQGYTTGEPSRAAVDKDGNPTQPVGRAPTNPNTASTLTGAPSKVTDPVAAAPNQPPGTSDSEEGERTVGGVDPDTKSEPAKTKTITREVERPVIRITLAATKPYRFTPRGDGITHWTNGHKVQAGHIVYLTEAQALAFRDRFEPVDDSGFEVHEDVEPYDPNHPMHRAKR